MRDIIDHANWKSFLRRYSDQNEGKPTRLGIMDIKDDVANDYWLEDGLPLIGLDVYPDKGKTRVDIIFDDFTHSIDAATTLVHVNGEHRDYGLDVTDAEGKTAVLRFENWPLRIED
jgi:hypothetical protein